MPSIIVQANNADGSPVAHTLIERPVPVHLQNGHYTAGLVERLAWAIADAEQVEAQTNNTRLQDQAGDAS